MPQNDKLVPNKLVPNKLVPNKPVTYGPNGSMSPWGEHTLHGCFAKMSRKWLKKAKNDQNWPFLTKNGPKSLVLTKKS